jgi:hypothetical protein
MNIGEQCTRCTLSFPTGKHFSDQILIRKMYCFRADICKQYRAASWQSGIVIKMIIKEFFCPVSRVPFEIREAWLW